MKMNAGVKAAHLTPLLVFTSVLFVYVARRPDIVANAQFWAEDGVVWFRDALIKGRLEALAAPHAGYFQTFSRVAIGFASLFPWEISPLIANVIGLVFRALPAAFFASARFDWIDPRARVLIVGYYLLMPNLGEVHANVTNTHWYLALYLGLVAIAAPSRSSWWRAHDWVVICLCGISGPFILFALPGFALRAWFLRTERLKFAVVAAFGALALVTFVMTGLDSRPKAPLGADVFLAVQIAVDRIVLGFIADVNSAEMHPLIVLCLAAASVLLAIYVIAVGRWQLAAILALPTAMFAATLASPVASTTDPQWPILLTHGGRYFVVPSIVWAATLVAAGSYALAGSNRASKNFAFAVGLLVICATLFPRFHIPALPDMGWTGSVAAYRAADDGVAVELPITPPGWSIRLPSGIAM